MSGTFFGINAAYSALQAQQAALNVMSDNIANASTPGYKRQSIVLGEGSPAASSFEMGSNGFTTVGGGVVVEQVQRMQDDFIDSQVRQANGQSSMWSAQSDTLSQVESVFNEPSNSGIQSQLDSFFSAWSALSTNPSDAASRQGVITAGQSLAQGIQTAYAGIKQSSDGVATKITDDVTQINSLATQLANLDWKITSATGSAGNQAPNDLLDQRDTLIDSLSSLAGVSVSGQSGGELTVTLGGKILIQGTVSNALAVRTNAAGATEVYSVSDGSTTNVSGGEVGGLLTLRNQTLPALMTGLDNFASTLVNQVNALHATGVLANGFGAGNFFTPNTTAANISVAATSATVATSTTGATGNGGLALQISDLANQKLATGQTINGMYQTVVTGVGTQSQLATSMAKTQSLSLQQFKTQQQSVSGVSIDEEMANMVKYQQAYGAAARVLTTCNDILSTLIDKVGV